MPRQKKKTTLQTLKEEDREDLRKFQRGRKIRSARFGENLSLTGGDQKNELSSIGDPRMERTEAGEGTLTPFPE